MSITFRTSKAEALSPAVKHIVEIATAEGDWIDAHRKLPDNLVAALEAADIFRLLVPQRYGGAELDFLDYLTIVEEIAKADASTAWCVNQAAVAATNAARTPPKLAEEVWGQPSGRTANGPLAKQTATRCEGGYLLNGRWDFASGCLNASWVMAFARVDKTDGKGVEGRQFFIPQTDVAFIDVWQVSGLRGTGSMSFELTDHFVSEERCGARLDAKALEPGPVYKLATHILFSSGFASTALGAARAGLNAVIELAGQKKPGLDHQILGEKQTVQRQIGQAEATLRAARTYMRAVIQRMFDEIATQDEPSLDLRVEMRMATTHAIRASEQVIDIAYNVAGSSAIFIDRPIQRRFQDVHAITQQIQGRLEHYDTAGRYYLGQTDNLPHL